MTRAVIFDIDGTLIDSVPLHARAWQEALKYFGFALTYEQCWEQIGKGGDQLLPALIPPEVAERSEKEISDYRSKLFKDKYLPQVKAFPQVRKLFERVKADGRRVALASSAKKDELAAYKRIAGIEDLVEAETSSDDADRSKPHPDIFHAALKPLGNPDPVTVVVVGDTPYDAEAAGKAGLRTVGVRGGGWPAEKLTAAGCVAVYRDPADLLREYERSPLGSV
ncbi:MAG: HAD family hydrolase [Gemmataceae bacterium]|nr:HAD family hydrolase [Gemmataceae bacterium]